MVILVNSHILQKNNCIEDFLSSSEDRIDIICQLPTPDQQTVMNIIITDEKKADSWIDKLATGKYTNIETCLFTCIHIIIY